ncbi:MAG: pantetheine-phosphate adenylyltransferase [Proteobacteria bacterium]|nr:pantetheine-phosphate adenylyltransferase [Pseudomonadota bacterium]
MDDKTAQPKGGVYAGTFDPITRGHLDIIVQAARVVPRLIILAAVNADKHPVFTDEECVDMIRHEIDAYVKPLLAAEGVVCDISVEKYAGLTAAFMEAHNAPFYIRGLRPGTDFDNEYPIAMAGRREYPAFQPLFFVASDANLNYVSSSIAREMARLGGKSLSAHVTPYVEEKLKQKLRPPAP